MTTRTMRINSGIAQILALLGEEGSMQRSDIMEQLRHTNQPESTARAIRRGIQERRLMVDSAGLIDINDNVEEQEDE